MDSTERISTCVLAVPEVAAWPQMAGLFERAASKPRPDWEWPLIACRAVGGDVDAALPGAAAIACMYVSIILVDDMLDEDPRGEHLRSGVGPTANLALAFQAAAFRVVEQAAVSAERRVAVNASLARLALATALGQHLDVQNPEGEESYWRVVRAKSTPFYSTALHVGALLGDAGPDVAVKLRDLGTLFGEVIQIHDDLLDAFQAPAAPDWTQGRPNLLTLYARTADYPDRNRFVALLPQVGDSDALREAQQILIRCGAVSYCAYHLAERHRRARQLLAAIPLVDATPMAELFAQLVQPLIELLRSVGAELPAELAELMP
jgi:geranylgeranyl diphosphate synthase type I